MNKILKMITACFVLPASFLCANTQEVQDERNNDCCCVDNSFGYLNIGVGPLPDLVPSFGIGYRSQRDHHGFDLSACIAKTDDNTTGRANVVYNYFFTPNLQSEFYVGLGLGIEGTHIKEAREDSYVAVYPEIVFGKQYQNETCCQRFFQVRIGFPFFVLDKIVKKTWKIRKSDYSISYPTSFNTSYVPEVIFSYGVGF